MKEKRKVHRGQGGEGPGVGSSLKRWWLDYTSEEISEFRRRSSKRLQAKWDNMTEEERKEFAEASKRRVQRMWSRLLPEEELEIREKMSKAKKASHKKKNGYSTPEHKERMRNLHKHTKHYKKAHGIEIEGDQNNDSDQS